MVQTYDTDLDGTNNLEYVTMGGTKTQKYFLSEGKNRITTDEFNTHSSVNTTDGSAHTAQMLLKPRFNLTAVTNTLVYSNSDKTITFKLDETSTHTWLSYLPKLVGYYIVSEAMGDGLKLTNNNNERPPLFMAKILSHRVSTIPRTNAIEAQEIILDTPINLSANGVYYRLMRVSETTFNNTEEINLNVLENIGTINPVNFATGKADAKSPDYLYQESVYSMYLMLDIDNINSTIERRTQTLAGATFTNGETINCHITDGENTIQKNLTIEKVSSDYTLKLSYAGSLNGNGVVSFGEIFTTTLNKSPSITRPSKCTIGTTFSIGGNLDNEIETIVKESGLDFDSTNSFVISTGNIVNTQNSTTIVCLSAVANIVVGDTLYSNDGHIIGEVSAISGSTITFPHKYYTPIQYDELIKYNKKTYISTLKFNNVNALDAINMLMGKKGLDYTIKNNVFSTRDIDDTSLLSKYSISWQDENRLIKVNSNNSLFDESDKVLVIGDKVSYEMDLISKSDNEGYNTSEKLITVIDVNIQTVNEARIKALEILNLHSNKVRKIELVVQRKGLELLDAGDYVNLNFPSHGIPKDDYMVFEIKNVIAGNLVLIVGTYNKTIAERLSELSLTQNQSSSTLLSEDGTNIVAGKLLINSLKINIVSVEYEITGLSNSLSYNSNMGFDDIVGFGTDKLGFRHSTVTKKDFKQRLHDNEEEI